MIVSKISALSQRRSRDIFVEPRTAAFFPLSSRFGEERAGERRVSQIMQLDSEVRSPGFSRWSTSLFYRAEHFQSHRIRPHPAA